MRLPENRPPTHPGEMLREEFLAPLAMTQSQLASLIGVPYPLINRIVNRRRAITADLSLRLGKLFGTTPDFWLNGQLAWDLYHAMHSKTAAEIERIEPLRASA